MQSNGCDNVLDNELYINVVCLKDIAHQASINRCLNQSYYYYCEHIIRETPEFRSKIADLNKRENLKVRKRQ